MMVKALPPINSPRNPPMSPVTASNNRVTENYTVSPVNVVIYPKQIATVMKPSFWLTIYMYKQHIKISQNQTFGTL